MASVRPTKNGKFELTVRHASLPKGRKFFTFDDEAEARRYGEQWEARKNAGLAPPQALLEPTEERRTLGFVLRSWANSGKAAPTEQSTLKLLISEVGDTKIAKADFAWADAWVDKMKSKQHLAPGSIRKRVGAMSRALDAFLRASGGGANPLKLLPKGYSAYTEADALVAGGAKVDVERDRRLLPGEHEAILAATAGGPPRKGRERAWAPSGDADMRLLYLTIIWTGLRLREAYRLEVADIDLKGKVIRARKSKLWRGKVAFKEVPMRPELHAELTAYVKGRSGRVFPFWDGTEEDLNRCSARLSARFATLFDYAQCSGLTEHDLRHEATCQWLEMKDASGWLYRIEEVNRIMGWSPTSKMAARYASFRGSDLAQRLWPVVKRGMAA